MAECNCGATTDGAWTGVHTKGCASLQPATTGITDVEWLDAQVCKLSDENVRLRAALQFYANEANYDEFFVVSKGFCVSEASCDNGQRAREALNNT